MKKQSFNWHLCASPFFSHGRVAQFVIKVYHINKIFKKNNLSTDYLGSMFITIDLLYFVNKNCIKTILRDLNHNRGSDQIPLKLVASC